MKRLYIIICLLLPYLSFAQLGFDPQVTGMANSIGASARGIRASMINPALLSMPFDHTSQMSLLTFQVNFNNNSFSNNNYMKYFASGNFLDDNDKKNILDLISDNGMRVYADGKMNLLGLYSNGMAFNLLMMGSGDITIPKNFMKLALYGNDLNKTYKFDDIKGEAWAGLATTVSYSQRFENLSDIYLPYFGDIDFWSAGITGKYILGLLCGRLHSSEAKFMTGDQYIQGEYRGYGDISQGGNGYGLDLGTAISFEDSKWVFSLSFNNILGGIKWHKDNKHIILTSKFDSLSLSELEDDDLPKMERDTTSQSFYTYLPTYIDLGASYRYNSMFLFTFEYEQGLRKTLGSTYVPRFGFGTEINYFKVFPVRGGISLGGKYGFSMGTGFSLDLDAFVWDFGIANHGGFFGNWAKGVSVATGMTFQW